MAKTWEVVKTALTAIPQLTIMEKLDVGLTLSELQKAINCLAMKRLLEAMAVVLRRTFQKDSQFCSTLPIRPAWHDHAQTSLMITCSRVLWPQNGAKGYLPTGQGAQAHSQDLKKKRERERAKELREIREGHTQWVRSKKIWEVIFLFVIMTVFIKQLTD